MFKRILVPLDGSRLAEAALPAALELASKFDSQVTLLRVVADLHRDDIDQGGRGDRLLPCVAPQAPRGSVMATSALLSRGELEAIPFHKTSTAAPIVPPVR